MDCPKCKNETIMMEEDQFSGCTWFICKCGTEIGIKEANKDVLESYFPEEELGADSSGGKMSREIDEEDD